MMGCFVALLLCCSLALARATVCNVAAFGAIGDGKTLDTAALQRAFDASTCQTVIVPAGRTFLTGALNWTRSDAVLVVDGTLLATTNSSLFPPIPEVPSYPCDRDICAPLRHSPVVLFYRASNFAIRGAGTIDGQGQQWWSRFHAKQLKWGRPRLLQLMSCQNVTISSVTLKDSPFWTTHLWNSSHIEVANVRVRSPRTSPNTDGVDPDSCNDVYIHDCDIEEGDDCIAVKSGMNEAGRAFGVPCSNVVVERVTCRGEAFAVGSEMSGGIHNVSFVNCTLREGSGGLHIKTSMQRGGYMRDINYDGISGWGDVCVNIQTTYQRSGNATLPLPKLSNFRFSRINFAAAKAGVLACTATIPCANVTLADVHIKSVVGFTCDAGLYNATATDVKPAFCKSAH